MCESPCDPVTIRVCRNTREYEIDHRSAPRNPAGSPRARADRVRLVSCRDDRHGTTAAVKIVREAEGCDLSAAVARVDAALNADPAAKVRVDEQTRARRKSLRVWIVLIDILLVAAALYWLLY
jgi:hypothetical protein